MGDIKSILIECVLDNINENDDQDPYSVIEKAIDSILEKFDINEKTQKSNKKVQETR